MKGNYCRVGKSEILNQPIGSIGFFNYEYKSIEVGGVGWRGDFVCFILFYFVLFKISEIISLSPLRLWRGSEY